MASRLIVGHLELSEANELVTALHRHHKKATGHRFSLGVYDAAGALRGAAIIGRPVARMTDQRNVVEVVRLVTDGCENACSALYSASARAAKALGYQRIQTFILASEPGTSLRAAGWLRDGDVIAAEWGRPSRARTTHVPEAKAKWSRSLIQ